MCIYTIVRGRIKGAACGHIWHIHRAAATAGSVLLSQGCIFQLQGSILLSQGCIFSTAREYIAESGVQIIHNCSTEKQFIFGFYNGIANSSPVLTIGEPLPAPVLSISTTAKASHKFSRLFVQR